MKLLNLSEIASFMPKLCPLSQVKLLDTTIFGSMNPHSLSMPCYYGYIQLLSNCCLISFRRKSYSDYDYRVYRRSLAQFISSCSKEQQQLLHTTCLCLRKRTET